MSSVLTNPAAWTPLGSRAAILGAALLWSTGGVAIKLSEMNAAQIAGGRAIFAAMALFVLCPPARRRPNQRIFATSLAYATTCGLFVLANTLTTAGSAIFLQNVAPFWVLLLSRRFTGEAPTKRELAAVPICLLGAGLFFGDDLGGGHAEGMIAALLASVSYAVLILLYRRVDSAEGLSATVAGNVLLVFLCLPFAVFGPTPGPQDLLVVAYLGLVQQGCAALLFIAGIRGVTALDGALLILAEPVFSPVWAFLLVGERLGPFALAGATLIALATVWRIFPARSAAAS